MNLIPRTALGHTLGALRILRIAALGTIPAALWLLVGPAAGTADAEPAGEGTASGTIPWYVSPAVTLLAAAVTAWVTWLTGRWNRVQQRRDRIERREREAERRAEAEQRARRTAWAFHFERIEETFLAIGILQQEAQRRRLHGGDAAASELQRLERTVEQYADHVPGVLLPAALQELAEALAGIDRHLLPEAAELDRISLHSSPSTACLPLFAHAGEQARAADHLARALKDGYHALHQEWGMN